MLHLAISIPAYNDAETLEPLVEESLSVLAGLTPNHGVLVINDGSRDRTSEVLKGIAAKHPRVRVVEHPRNFGFGRTIREVYLLPESEWVFFIPGDGQIPPSELLKLYPSMRTHQFILGHRRQRNDPPLRRLNSWVYNRVVSLLSGRRVRDVNSVALVRRDIFEGAQFRSRSAFIHAELFLEAARRGAAIAEVEIIHKPRAHGRGAGNRWRVIFATVADMLQYFFRRRRAPEPEKKDHGL